MAEVPALLALWNKNAPIDVADALKLLSKEKCFEHSFVREYAVSILRSASDDELLTFLLQLVQALRYEPSPTVAGAAQAPVVAPVVDYALESSLVSSNHLDNNVRLSEAVSGNGNGNVEDPASALAHSAITAALAALPPRNAGSLSPLANFLIDRACASPTVANYFYWYLKVETEDEQSGLLFQTVFENFIVQLGTSGAEGKMLYRRLSALDEYIAKISGCQRDAREQGRRKPEKELALRALLEERKLSALPNGVDWVPMPLDPSIQLMGLIPSTASMFASAVYPCVIEFTDFNDQKITAAAAAGGATPSSKNAPAPRKTLTHKIMFKSGDDLRQDQLIMQMIALMDRLLKKVNLDLKLLTYGILAVGQKDGECTTNCRRVFLLFFLLCLLQAAGLVQSLFSFCFSSPSLIYSSSTFSSFRHHGVLPQLDAHLRGTQELQQLHRRLPAAPQPRERRARRDRPCVSFEFLYVLCQCFFRAPFHSSHFAHHAVYFPSLRPDPSSFSRIIFFSSSFPSAARWTRSSRAARGTA